MNLVKHLQRQRAFSQRAFGPGKRVKGILDHIRKELAEIEANPNDVYEWIDVAILALDGAWRQGYSPHDICGAINIKMGVLESRKYPDWREKSEDEAIEHVRT